MGLFSRSGPSVGIVVSPETVRPRQAVRATVVADKPVDKVTSARLEWGYENFYRYHWAGRADSAVAKGNDAAWLLGEVGTNYGSERDTSDWVCVTTVDIPVGDTLTQADSTFTVPSWAPGSSPEVAAWACRLVVERDGRDIDTRAEFSVEICAADVTAEPGAMETLFGDGEANLEITLPSAVYLAGDTVVGQLHLRPQLDLPKADIAVHWQRIRQHHPLVRYPALGGELDGPPMTVAKGLILRTGDDVVLPFALPLPSDAAPTASATHSSLSWAVAARVFYAGFSRHQVERLRRPIVVVNAR